ncbi:unnamed protein product [Rotaria magnacalcarata]|uniref:Uncharacterized protein n=1 Tax=Rotaria magnacalcarata TaxID=392030 RepID=A0A819F479_9BILA|nr:unnamed protein product [Rotaria magnacalcarata]CAF2145042.1 unnamed protein product [Rotaria magnacalcarata]CAF3731994.1 unnamed protein product [Rotaria magnacalcarata]CAF3858609.1 unnamed protein product [Rotaria magnacalcarata]
MMDSAGISIQHIASVSEPLFASTSWDRWKSIQCVQVALIDVEFNSVHPGPAQSLRRRMSGTGICVEYLSSASGLFLVSIFSGRRKSIECLRVVDVDVEFDTRQNTRVRNHRQRMVGPVKSKNIHEQCLESWLFRFH